MFFNETVISGGLWVFYILLGIAILSTILFPIINGIKHPATLLKALYGVGALVVMFGVSYSLSSTALNERHAAMGIVSDFMSRLIGAGLIMFYLLLLGSILSMVYSEINKAIK